MYQIIGSFTYIVLYLVWIVRFPFQLSVFGIVADTVCGQRTAYCNLTSYVLKVTALTDKSFHNRWHQQVMLQMTSID